MRGASVCGVPAASHSAQRLDCPEGESRLAERLLVLRRASPMTPRSTPTSGTCPRLANRRGNFGCSVSGSESDKGGAASEGLKPQGGGGGARHGRDKATLRLYCGPCQPCLVYRGCGLLLCARGICFGEAPEGLQTPPLLESPSSCLDFPLAETFANLNRTPVWGRKIPPLGPPL